MRMRRKREEKDKERRGNDNKYVEDGGREGER